MHLSLTTGACDIAIAHLPVSTDYLRKLFIYRLFCKLTFAAVVGASGDPLSFIGHCCDELTSRKPTAEPPAAKNKCSPPQLPARATPCLAADGIPSVDATLQEYESSKC